MTKDYHKFIHYIKEEKDIDNEKPDPVQVAGDKQRIDNAFERKKEEAIRKSEKAGAPDYAIYQDKLLDPAVFEIQPIEKQMDLESRWRLIAQVINGKFNQLAPLQYEIYDDEMHYTNEQLSVAGRRALKRSAKKRKAKLKIARTKAKHKIASKSKLFQRAQRRSRLAIKKKLMHGKTGKVSHSQLNRIQNMVNARHGQLDTLRRKLVPQVRKDDKKRR